MGWVGFHNCRFSLHVSVFCHSDDCHVVEPHGPAVRWTRNQFRLCSLDEIRMSGLTDQIDECINIYAIYGLFGRLSASQFNVRVSLRECAI